MPRQSNEVSAEIKAAEQADGAAQAAHEALAKMNERREGVAAELAQAEKRLSDAAATMAAGDDGAGFDQATDEITRLRARIETYDEQVLPSAAKNIEAAESEAAEAHRRVVYAKAKQLADAAEAELVATFPKLSETLHRLQTQLSEAEDAVELANKDLPRGLPPISEAEGRVRDQSSREDEAVRESFVECWVYSETGERLPEDRIGDVREDQDGTGHVAPASGVLASAATGTKVEKRRFRRVEILPAQSWRRGGRLRSIDLGELRIGAAEPARVRFEPLDQD